MSRSLRIPAARTLIVSLAVALAWFAAGRLGFEFASLGGASDGGGAIAVWPAAGVGVAAILLGGPRLIPAVALGALATALSSGEAIGSSLLAALGDVLEPLIAYRLLRGVGFRVTLRRTNDVAAFVALAALLSTAVGASVGTLSLLAGGTAGWSNVASTWRDWWIGDLSGVLIVGSALLVLATTPLSALRTRATAEVVALVALFGVITYLLLEDHGSVRYLVLPMLFVIAYAYRQRGAAIGGLVAAGIAIALTLRGDSPFPGGTELAQLIRAQTFVCVGSLTALLVAAAQSERDVAEQAVDRLAESESALAEAQRLAHVGSFELDFRSGRTWCSDELYRMLGRGPGELVGDWHTWLVCVHPGDVERVGAAFRQAYREGHGSAIVHRIVRPDGQVRTVEARFRFELDGDGPPVRIVGTCHDVTAIKLAEQRFRSLFEDAPYPIVVIDVEGRIALSNLRAQQLFGFDADELEGREAEQLMATPAGSAAWWAAEQAAAPAGEVELTARRRDGSEFPVEVSLTQLESEDGVLVSAAIRDVTLLREAARTLTYQARHDQLTGLPNRLMFLERLDHALVRSRRSQRSLAVVFVDLDNFKEVNDTRGHDAGDLLLSALTPRLLAAVRAGDTVARLGGDEFVVLCEELESEAEALGVAHRLADAALAPIVVAGCEHTLSISAGVVMVPDPAAVTAHGVLRDADAAMYAAKASGKGRVAVFDKRMREQVSERLEIESALRGALARDELMLHYQPVVSLEGCRVTAVEALIRWQHPSRGLLAPDEFVPVAEASGLIGELGEWALEEACRQAVRWRDSAAGRQPVPVSVNVSAYQLARLGIVAAVDRALAASGLEPALLELELTESALLEDPVAAASELSQLKQLGVRLVIDDFGTGYSSLPALRRFDVDGLKLDRSFVAALSREEGAASMVAAVVSIAGALGADLIAEGVETWEQAERLRDQGCTQGQGFLFGRPGPAEDLAALLEGASGEAPWALPLAEVPLAEAPLAEVPLAEVPLAEPDAVTPAAAV